MAKIISKDEFLKMPANTVYRECGPCWFDKLSIKGVSWDNGYWFQELCKMDADDTQGMVSMFRSGSVKFDLDYEDGYGFSDDDENKQYLVYGNDDLNQLINRLKECII